MEEEGPFGSLIKQCLPTSSQEDFLRTCPFARQSEVFSGDIDGDSPSLGPLGIPVSSTGIVMLSPLEDFQTPPEDSIPAPTDAQMPPPPPPAVIVDALSSRREAFSAIEGCTDSERSVDLGKDSDNLGFSETNSTQMISGWGGGDGFFCCAETIHQEDANTEIVDLETEEIGEGLSEDKVFVDLPMRETDVGVAVNKGTEVQKNVNGLARKNVEDLDKFKYVRPSGASGVNRKITRWVGGLRELPSSISGQEKNTGEEREMGDVAGKNRILKSLLDALKWVAGEMGEGSVVDFDFLETAKSCGMTFPQPRWWPPEGYDD
ncbi:Titin like [Actinidia chinensis var. chinensis]|uniref:Titin like n=1 Tax=Actinidia chinensis var. chinensis TaxID=1590841 RepID=A0A2R6PJ63_ACTCC|nr:Titin like [Actinidia chinensis var. chinensis]